MKYETKLQQLDRYSCSDPEWFLRDHVPRHADYYGMTFENSFQSVLGEIVALDDVRRENFEMLLSSGIAQKVLTEASRRGISQYFGERLIIIQDNMLYRGVKNEVTQEIDWLDPATPITLANFRRMVDAGSGQYVPGVSLSVGRPNSNGELWLQEPFNRDDYDLVVGCFKRLVNLRESGAAPHLVSALDHIYIPANLGQETYSAGYVRHDPVEYVV